MKILIPTCKDRSEIDSQICEIFENTPGADIFSSCTKASASVNRNMCLDQIQAGEVAIMIDDDITGFYPGWDTDLAKPLEDESFFAVSARLLNKDGKFGQTCSACYEPSPDLIEIKLHGHCVMPTAAIAFRYKGIRFDEAGYAGSGFEDDDWFCEHVKSFPELRYAQSNACSLCHLNEMKNQKGKFWDHNIKYFREKWGKL